MKIRSGDYGYKAMGIVLCCIILVGCFLISIVFGSTPISWENATAAFTDYDETSMEQVIVRTTRLPRACIAAAIGASLAIAGAIMQAITRNALASPSVLGINAGATLGVVLAITVFSIVSMKILLWISFAGAGIGAISVYLLGSLGRDGLSPLKVILAGSAMSALFISFTQGLLVHNENSLNDVLFWLTGSVAGRSMGMLYAVLPYMALGWLASLFISRDLNILVMGEDAAKSLGQHTAIVKVIAGIVIIVLAGGSVAIAGPIGFIGIVIPHVARYLSGRDYRWLIPYCALLGAILLLLSDVLARFIIMPEEIPVGVMTAIIGTPFFIYIARKGKVQI